MNVKRLILIAALALLSACSTNHRPVYSGHEESTEGVPGFVNGKKVSPHVKLGQSYSVDGETYVPHNQPDYVEEGMASWYGPGFHGGKTANGESFDTGELTAAHRTLPLPSIVRVTLLSTGKQAYVRINDRGPFAHSRIIDLSRAAADKIGLLRLGVAKVRIEYMKKESVRFADLLAQGRDPKSIDLASEVINYDGGGSETSVAANSAPSNEAIGSTAPHSATHANSFWDNLGSSAANAAEPDTATSVASNAQPISNETNEAAPVADIASNDLSPPKQATPTLRTADSAPLKGSGPAGESPFNVMASAAGQAPPPRKMEMASLAPATAPPSTSTQTVSTAPATPGGGSMYVQLGAFQNAQNAEKIRQKYASISGLTIVKKSNAGGQTLYHVRMGPYSSNEASNAALKQLQSAGTEAKIVKE